MDNNDILQELQDRRLAVCNLIYRAQVTLADLDEQIRFAGGGDPGDFSGAIDILRKKGVLPAKKK